jgi:hypothetical protein
LRFHKKNGIKTPDLISINIFPINILPEGAAMILQVGLENDFEGRSLAWALDFPGCFSYGSDASAAVLNLPQALIDYQAWVEKHTHPAWVALGDFDIRLVEVWQDYAIDGQFNIISQGRRIQAWFRHDWKPLSAEEITHDRLLLQWGQQDLLDCVAPLNNEQLDHEFQGERWSIRGILTHVATSQWWLLDRLGFAEGKRDDLPADAFERLAATGQMFEKRLPDFEELVLAQGKEGEFWSPRKLLRRAIWHNRDHLIHIQKLINLTI